MAIKEQNKIELKKLPIGSTFEIWNRKYTVLDKENDRVLCLAAEIEDKLPFRNGAPYKVALNDFRDSDIRNWLNGEYLVALQRDGFQNGQILDMEVDLKCTLGYHEYGKDIVKVGLLTLEKYGQYYDIIPRIYGPWWLATPCETPSRTRFSATGDVWGVHSDGEYFKCHWNDMRGVRPVLTISGSLLVSWVGEHGDGDWDGYIKYLHKWAVEHSNKCFEGCCPVNYDEWAVCDKEDRE